MNKSFNLWRFIINVGFAKSFLWAKDEDTYFIHIGTFTNGKDTALKIVFLPFSFMVGFIKIKEKGE